MPVYTDERPRNSCLIWDSLSDDSACIVIIAISPISWEKLQTFRNPGTALESIHSLTALAHVLHTLVLSFRTDGLNRRIIMVELLMIAPLIIGTHLESHVSKQSLVESDWQRATIVHEHSNQPMPRPMIVQASGSGSGMSSSGGGSTGGGMGSNPSRSENSGSSDIVGGHSESNSPTRPGPGRSENPGSFGVDGGAGSISPSTPGPGRTESPGSSGIPGSGTETISPSLPGTGRTEHP